MSYSCSACAGARPVQILLTNLADGSTDCSCADDLPIMYIGHLALRLDVDPQRLYDAIERFTKREAEREAKQLAAAQATTVVEGQQPKADGSPFDDPEHPFHGAKDLVGDAVLGGDGE